MTPIQPQIDTMNCVDIGGAGVACASESDSNRLCNAITLIFHKIPSHRGVQAAARRRDISLTLAI